MGKREHKPYEKHTRWVYAVYKGDKFIYEGTRDEICAYLEIKPKTFGFYRTHHYAVNRNTKFNNRVMIFRIDGPDKIWES